MDCWQEFRCSFEFVVSLNHSKCVQANNQPPVLFHFFSVFNDEHFRTMRSISTLTFNFDSRKNKNKKKKTSNESGAYDIDFIHT